MNEWHPATGADNKIDNDEHTMREAIAILLAENENSILDIASGYFRLSGLSLLKDELKIFMEKDEKKPKMRWLLSNRIDKNAANIFNDEPISEDTESFSISNEFFKLIKNWIVDGKIEIRVFVGEDYIRQKRKKDIKFLHGKAYLFSSGKDSSRGDAIVGSSNFTRGGLLDNRELNIFTNDAWPALHAWFEELWNNYSLEYSNELIDDFEQQKKFAKSERAYTPVEYLYWILGKKFGVKRNITLSQRINLIEERLPYTPNAEGHRFFDHQRTGIKKAYEKLKEFDAQILADGVGLGKTLEAATIIKLYFQDLKFAEDKRSVLLVVNERLREQWKEEFVNVGIFAHQVDMITRQKFANFNEHELKKMAEKYALVVIDEAHDGFLKASNRSYKNMRIMIQEARERQSRTIRGLLLTATPWNNSREDIVRLGLLFLNSKCIPYDRKYRDYVVSGREKALFDAKGNGEFNQIAYQQFWQDLFIQRTRGSLAREKFLSDRYPKRTFPLESNGKPYKIEYSSNVSKALQQTLTGLINLHLPYQDTVMQYLNKEKPSNVVLRQRQQLLRRADSSNAAFSKSMEHMYDRLNSFKKDIEYLQNESLLNVKKYFFEQIDKEYASQITNNDTDLFTYEPELKEINTVKQTRIKLIDDEINETNRNTILRNMLTDTNTDLRSLDEIQDRWSLVAKNDEKQNAIFSQIIETIKEGRKVLVFSEYADTVNDYYQKILTCPEILKYGVGKVTGGGAMLNFDASTKENVLGSFSPVSKNFTLIDEPEIAFLIGTDAIATGQNLQDASDVMTIELPYNPMRLEQRIGRIDRPKKNGMNEIHVYAYPSDEVINAEIELMSRYERKVAGAVNDTEGDINLPFVNDVKIEGVERALSTVDNNESTDKLSKPDLVSEDEARERVQDFYDKIGPNFNLESGITYFPVSVGNKSDQMIFMYDVQLRDVNNHDIVWKREPVLSTVNSSEISFVEAENIVRKAIHDKRNDLITEKTFVELYDKANENSKKLLKKLNDEYNAHIKNEIKQDVPVYYVANLKRTLMDNKNSYRSLFKKQGVDGEKFMKIVRTLTKRGFNRTQKNFLQSLRNTQGTLDSKKIITNVWENIPRFIEIFTDDQIENMDVTSEQLSDIKNSNLKLLGGIVSD